MQLDRALHFAVILGWDDLTQPDEPCSVRVEYLTKPQELLEGLSVWAVDENGHQFLVCECSTETSMDHPSAVRFGSKYKSPKMGQALEFILMNQEQFTRSLGQGRGLVIVAPPSLDDRAEASSWAKTAHEAQASLAVHATQA